MRRVAYVTDVEGRWDKLAAFAEDNPLLSLDAADRLVVAPGALFVFGGDAVDRGPAGLRILRTLADAKARQPDQVVLLAGNRDLNKLRLFRELRGAPPRRTPPALQKGPPEALLRWIFENTMGARQAFEHRRTELSLQRARGASDAEVAESYLVDLRPGGALRDFLAVAQLAHREGPTLFVHGAVTEENLGVVPGEPQLDDVDAWIAALNRFYRRQLDAFLAADPHRLPVPDEEVPWAGVVAYQAPLPGSRLNQSSVIYARPTDESGMPRLPQRGVVQRLLAAGVERVVVGHTPSGDCPALLRDQGFSLLLADNSYGRIESGSQVIVEEQGLRVRGLSELDGGERVRVDYTIDLTDPRSPLGRLAGGALVKARLARGDLLLFRPLLELQVEQRAVAEPSLAGLALGPPGFLPGR